MSFFGKNSSDLNERNNFNWIDYWKNKSEINLDLKNAPPISINFRNQWIYIFYGCTMFFTTSDLLHFDIS
jgi:hypothetical protein